VKPDSHRKLLFLGSKAAGLTVCRQLVRTLPPGVLVAIVCPDDSSDERSAAEGFRDLSRESGIPLIVVGSRAQTLDIIERFRADIAIVHGWYRLLPVEEFPSTRFFGFHYSPLPRYRGNAPLVWQILKGESSFGVTLFEIAPSLDEGPIYDQVVLPLAIDEAVGDALERAELVACEMLGRFVRDWLGGEIRRRAQPDLQPTYCGLRVPEDGRIDWHAPAMDVHNFVRAQSRPYPGAFTDLPDGKRLVVWKSTLEPKEMIGVPGAVCEVSPSHVVVATGKGAIRVIEVQVEGMAASAASKVLNSLKIRLGQRR
jgi:methionyl-tRNA formyltransferase